MSWVAVAIGGSAVLGAGAGIYGANQASDAQVKGGKDAIAEQQRQYNIGLNLLEPQRALGYGALSDIAGMYGYAMPQYTPVNQLMQGSPFAQGSQDFGKHSTTDANGIINVSGRRGRTDYLNPAGVFGLGGNDKRAFGGSINMLTGEVSLDNMRNDRKEAKRESAATAYLRGESGSLSGSKFRRIREIIDRVRDSGYTYDPNAQANAAPPTAGIVREGGGNSLTERFQQMPGYQFGMSEGMRGIEQSAAARGGVLSGNNLRNVNAFAQDYAGTKFGEEFNRLLAMAGLGQTATGSAVNAGMNYANNAGNAYQNMGDARASGVVSGYGAASNALNSGLQNWMMYRGGYFNRPPGV
jgi:hypothetical protein